MLPYNGIMPLFIHHWCLRSAIRSQTATGPVYFFLRVQVQLSISAEAFGLLVHTWPPAAWPAGRTVDRRVDRPRFGSHRPGDRRPRELCIHMPIYANLCQFMPIYADLCRNMPEYAGINAEICWAVEIIVTIMIGYDNS